jgi:hypothetical protein
MSKIIILMVFMIFVLNACLGKPFQPTPITFTLWQKKGVSEDNIKKNMLECGIPNPYTSYGMTENAYAEAQLCMLDKGFVNTSRDGILCAQKEYQNRLSACKQNQHRNEK